MAGIISNVDSDVQKLRKLKSEIENVKEALKAIDIKVNIDIAKDLQLQLTSLLGQYDTLVDKIAAAEAKIMLSANRINKATEEIVKAQEVASKPTATLAQNGDTARQTNTAETESIQMQAKAYEELKAEIDDVLGARGQNIERLIGEQNAIRLLNEEIKKITKSQGESSSLLSAQQKRLVQLNNSLLTHKTTLAEVRQSLSANAKLDNVAATSMNALSQSLGRMRAAYRALTESERASPFGKELLVSIQQADAKIKELDATIGNHQRNVGNYASGWNGLSMSIQQIGRELPSLAVGWRTFFLAISNNLPILADEIKRAKIQFEALKKSGQAATPIWKQIVASLFSWQSALTVGITLLTLYGDKVVKWISGLGKAKEAIRDLYTAQRDLYNVTSTGIEQSSKEITKLNGLYKIATDITKSTKERNNAVKELKKSYPEHLKNLSDESIKNGEVSKAIKEQTTQIIANAKATAAADQIAKNWYKSFQAGVSKNIAYITKQRLEQELVAKEAMVQQLSQMRARPESYAGLAKEIEGIKERIEETDKEIKKQENLQDSYQKSSKALEKLVTVAGLGGKYEDPDKNYNSIVDQQKKIADLLNKQALERRRKEEDLENQVIQSRIDAMADGEEKIRAQRELDNKKEIQDLKRQREDYIQKEIEYQKKLFDAQEDLNAKKSKDYRKRTFNPSSVKVDTSRFTELISNELTQQAIAPYRKEMQTWNEYLIEYGNFQQKKAAINAEYNQKIAEAATKGEKESLKKQQANKLKEVTFDELKKSINFADIFGDLDVQSTETLTKMRDKLKEIIDKSAKDLKPTDLKVLQEAFSNIDLRISERNPFGELNQGIDDYKSATEAVIKAQEDLNIIQQGGEVIIGVYTDETGKLVTKLLTQEQAERNLSDAQKKRLESQTKLTKAVNSIGEQGQQLVNAGNNLVDMLTNLGVEIPESISGALSGLGQIMSGLESIDLTKPFSIISSTTGILSGFVQTITSFFGGPNGTAYYESVKEQLESINEIYDRIIDKSKEEITFGGGFASIQAANQALDNYYKKVANLQKIADASGRAGASWKSHSAEWHSNKNVRAIGGFEQMSQILGKSVQSMGDLYYLTGDELYLVQSQLPEAWSQIDSRIKENLQSIIDCKDEANELKDALNQAMTGIDLDSFYNGFIDQLSDIDTSFEDMCDNFEGYLRKSIIAGLVANQYQGRINALYEQWSDAAKSGNKITENEAELLRGQYQQIVEDMMHDREEMFKSFGWDSSSSSSQESTKKGFAAASQDSIDELNGRFTALQISGEEIKNQNTLQTQSLNLLTMKADDILRVNTEVRNIADDTRDLIANSYLELVQISENTGAIIKPIQQIQKDISEVKNNTKGLSTK